MASSESSKPSSDIGQSDPCDKCLPSTCSSSDPYTAASPPCHLCTGCREVELEAEDTQNMDLHNPLIGLSKKPHELNLRHDQLTSKLPLELVSYIFTLTVVNDAPNYRSRLYGQKKVKLWNPAVKLGAVCKRWREITLGTPRLWTTITITEQTLGHTSLPDIMAQRLDRSCALPLTLEFDVDCEASEFPILSYTNIVPLLRDHVHRWKTPKLRTNMPEFMFYVLLTDLEETVTLDSLILEAEDAFEIGDIEIPTRCLVSPKRLDIAGVLLPQIPVQWGALTHLTADSITVDDLVHVFRHAHNLRHCVLHIIQYNAGHYPLPSSPVTNISMKQLEVNVSGDEPTSLRLLRHLTLPSLETLLYKVEEDRGDAPEELEALANFVDRSQPPLHAFSFTYFDSDEEFRRDWYRAFPSITSLELHVGPSYYLQLPHEGRTQDILERLGPHVEPMALPCLREMNVHTQEMNADCWKALAAMFPDYENDEDLAPVVRRPLKTVRIYLSISLGFNQQTMTGATYSRLLAIQKSGMTVQAFDKQGTDIFGLGSDAAAVLSRFLINDEYIQQGRIDQDDME